MHTLNLACWVVNTIRTCHTAFNRAELFTALLHLPATLIILILMITIFISHSIISHNIIHPEYNMYRSVVYVKLLFVDLVYVIHARFLQKTHRFLYDGDE